MKITGRLPRRYGGAQTAMHLDVIVQNAHLAPFILCFLVGFFVVIGSPVYYRRTGLRQVRSPLDLFRIDKRERVALLAGGLLVVAGLAGTVVVSHRYGYNRIVRDSEGNKRITRVYPGRVNPGMPGEGVFSGPYSR